MSRTVRVLAVSSLLVVLLAGPVAAATFSPVSGASSLWQWLVELILPGDPNGGKQPPTQGPNGDAGGAIDPNGVKVLGVTGEPRAEGGPVVR